MDKNIVTFILKHRKIGLIVDKLNVIAMTY